MRPRFAAAPRPALPAFGAPGFLAAALLAGFPLAAGAVPQSPGDPAAAAGEAARLYNEGDGAAAGAIWEGLLEDRGAGLDRGALHYNLGNAAFRAGRLGRAMLHWERALLFLPGDRDALANLGLAREILASRLAEAAAAGEGDPFALRLLTAGTGLVARLRRIPAERFAAALVAAACTAGVLVTLLLLGRGGRRLLAGGLVAVLVAAAVSGALLGVRLGAPPLAVVVEPGAALRSGPASTFPQLAALPEGFYLELGDRQGADPPGFLRVVAAGIVGYAEEGSVVPVEGELGGAGGGRPGS